VLCCGSQRRAFLLLVKAGSIVAVLSAIMDEKLEASFVKKAAFDASLSRPVSHRGLV
jgi:hypothetical protein